MRRGTQHQPSMAPMARRHRPMIGFMPPLQKDVRCAVRPRGLAARSQALPQRDDVHAG
jgi:hypothetical protein